VARLAEEHGLPQPRLHEGAALGYRHRARLMVRGRAGAPKIGLFAEGTHRVVDTPRCPIHHPRVNDAAACLRDALRALRAAPYSDSAHAGLVRALQVAVERGSGRAQVVVVCNEAAPGAASRALLAELAARLGPRAQSVWWNGQPGRTNVILGPHWERVAGEPALRERIGGADVFYPPGAFGQSHLDLADVLVGRLHDAVPDGARVAELYAGCGAIGLGLLARGARVAFNEEDESSLAGLALGLAARPEGERARAEVYGGPAGARLDALLDAEVVIVDPPRKGLGDAVVAALRERRPGRLVYVSCGLASFERESAALCAGGAFALRALDAFALLPYTEHVELLAVFEPA
jgi:tRNA/tmRNA/rRNA uracil-C5-methylase (TrmA/RlmC/RlmD family)